VLSPVHTGDCSRRIRRLSPKTATVAEFGDCRQNRRLSPVLATVAVFGDKLSPNGDYSLQCGQAISLSALAARPGASSVRDRGPGVQSLAGTHATIPQATQSRR